MSWSMKVVKIKGIDIKVHLTFFLILVWAADRWSTNTGEGLQGALFGIVATLLLFLSVTLHELGHSLQALKYGMIVRDITLMPMGGLAQMGLFNLIPAFPMDGGRILRASLAKKVNYARATKIATQVGQGLALLMGLYGFMSGSWTFIIIAIFVWIGAGQENQSTQVKHTLGDTTVGKVMTRSPHTLKANDTLSKAVELTLTTSQADFPVLEWGSNRVAGPLTQTDLLRGLQSHGAGAAVPEVMQTRAPSTIPDEPLHAAQQKMYLGQTRNFLVVSSEGNLLGMLTAEDINEAYRLMAVSPQLAISTRR